MVAIKTQGAASFLAKPDPAIRAFVFYGTDPGMVSERAQKLAQTLAARENPPGEIVRLDDNDLDNDPDRLAVELLTVPMFGGAKIVRTQASRRVTAAVIKPLLEGAPLPGALIIEAGNLRADEGFRALFEKSPAAAAIGCYADDGASLDQLINEVLSANGLKIGPEARDELAARLGADRALSRAELDKLALYAAGSGTVTLEQVETIVGDASELAIDRILTATASGDAAAALAECDRAVSSGESPQLIILMIQRYFQRLHRVRAGMDSGRTLDDVVRQLRPPVHFKQRVLFERQCRQWSTARLTAALARISAAAKAARFASSIETLHTERLLLELARLARQALATPRPA